MSIELIPGRLNGLYAQLSEASDRDRTLRLEEVVLGESALEEFMRIVHPSDCSKTVIVQDKELILRGDLDIKAAVKSTLTDSGVPVEIIELPGAEPHTTPLAIDTVGAVLTDGARVIALGSGTVADISKHAVHTFEEEHSGSKIRLIVVPTANSVCAYTSGLCVITTDGVKRTVPSRLPDTLIVDTTLLSDAPEEMTHGGIGDASVAANSFADYRLGELLGLSSWEPLSWELMKSSRERFLHRDPQLADRGSAGAAALALDLAACGLAMTLAGESAPLSGLEHVTSHMLDMSAPYDARPVGNHGSQCALATVLSLIVWEFTLERADLSQLNPREFDASTEQTRVQKAFSHLDITGDIWRACWSDYSEKLQQWMEHADLIDTFQSNWPVNREVLRELVATPEDYVDALAATGHPLRFTDIPTGITESQARWAFSNARLMRKRTSVADLLAFAGLWDEPFIDEVFHRYHKLITPFVGARDDLEGGR